jgi:hypothetical protein
MLYAKFYHASIALPPYVMVSTGYEPPQELQHCTTEQTHALTFAIQMQCLQR